MKPTVALKLLIWIVALMLAVFMSIALPKLVLGEQGRDRDLINETAEDIQVLQPYASDSRAHRLATLIVEATYASYIPPKIQVSYIFRESSFSPALENQQKFGSIGEVGLTQLIPRYLKRLPELMPEGCDESLHNARCQIITGANAHAYWKARCPGSTWRYLASYAEGECVTERAARMTKGAQNARRHYVKIGGTGTWE